MLLHYIKIAIRNLRRYKGQTLICVLGLSMGILSFTVCTYLVRLLVGFNDEFPNSERIGRVEAYNPDKEYWGTYPLEDLYQLKELKTEGIEAIAAVYFGQGKDEAFEFRNKKGVEVPFIVNTLYVNADFMEVFSVRLEEGDKQTFLRQPQSVLISRDAAKRIYGKDSPLGLTIRVGEKVWVIRGVMEEIPQPNSFAGMDPIDILYRITDTDSFDYRFRAYPLFSPGALLENINKQIEDSGIRLRDEEREGVDEMKEFVPRVEYISEGMKGAQQILDFMIPMAPGLLVLLAGLVNFLSFCIGSFYNRIRELSLRKTLGAIHKELFGQLFTEITLYLLLATLLSLCLTELVLPLLLNNLWDLIGMSININISAMIVHQLQYLMGIWLVCGVICWIAIGRLLKMPAMKGIRGGTRKGNKHGIRNTMLGLQLFIFLIFFGATAILFMQSKTMKKSLYSTLSVSEKESIWVVPLNFSQIKGHEKEVIDQLSFNVWVADYLIMGKHSLPLMDKMYDYTFLSGKQIEVGHLQGGPNLAGFLNLGLLQGELPSQAGRILINKSFRTLLDEDGVGDFLELGKETFYIAGVFEDTEFMEVSRGKDVCVIVEPVDIPMFCYLKSQPGKEKALRRHIETVMRQWIPDTLPVNVQTFAKRVGSLNLIITAIRNIFLVFGLISLFITVLGIYSAITLDTKRRQKEVAIRKINGAGQMEISVLFGRLYLWLMIVTTLIAFPLLRIISDMALRGFTTRYNLNNPLFWIILIIVALLIIVTTIGYRLYLTIRQNPSDIIKTD